MRTETDIKKALAVLDQCQQSGRYGGSLLSTIRDWSTALAWVDGDETIIGPFVDVVHRQEETDAIGLDTIWGTVPVEVETMI